MDRELTKSLTLLGLTPLQIRFFEASFRTGPATVPEIASVSKIRRSTAYVLAKELIAQGFLLEDHKDYSNKVSAIDPADVLRQIASKQRTFKRHELELEAALPSLQAFYKSSEIRPNIRSFQGNSGLIQVWKDILSTSGEILLWTNQQTENSFFGTSNHNKFITERIAKKIPIRVLATQSSESKDLQKLDSVSLRQTKILSKETTFSAETYIYDHKIAMLDYNKDIVGIIIESLPFSNFHKAIFESTWHNLHE